MADSPSSISRAARVTLVMSALFGTTGMVMPYLARWLEVERGLVGAEIGLVLSLASLARIVTGPLLAFWADGVADRRLPMQVIAAGAVLSYAAFFFIARDLASLLFTGFVALTLMQGLVPFVEGALLRATEKGKFSYGVARGIGSLAFIFANIAGGAMIARFGLGAVAAWVISSLTLTALCAFVLKRDPAPLGAHARSWSERVDGAKALLSNRRYLILIFACGLIQSGHAFYYSFSTLVWRAQGVSPEMVGQLWAIGVLVEVAFLWSLPLLERRSTPEAFILFGAAAGLVRWFAMGFAPLGLGLWVLQGMHGFTFAAAHIGAMRLLYREAPESSAGLSQTLYSALSGGLLMGLATIFSGFLYDLAGADGYWVMALLSLAGGALALQLTSPPPRGRLNA
ncbi:oligopeptide transport system permease protein OppB [alpha proteobacterium U9-1i]|nr:oligopeptide transport system permease protein OppB [alpha proteobacterium U9-1i]